MRRNLASTLIAGTLVALSIQGVTAESHAKTPKDMLVVAQNIGDIITIDPSFAYEPNGIEIVNNLYDTLVRVDPNDPTKVLPAAAERWEFSEDGSSITFFLRKGLKFHSGNPVTSEDVVFSLKRIVSLDALLTAFTQRLGWTKKNIDEAITAIDPHTVQLRVLSNVTPSLAMANIGTVMSAVVDKKLVMENERNGDMGREWLKTNSAGSGPFSLRSYKPGEGIVLEANPAYWMGAPAMKRVVIRHVPEPSSQRLLLESGDADIARNLPRDQLDALRESGKAKVQVNPKAEIVFLGTSYTHPALGHPKVLEAMRWLIDYKGMEQTFLRDDMRVSQTLWPYGPSALSNIYSLDVAKAKALLAEAGYGNGFKFKLDVYNASPWTQIGQSIKSTMAQAGIDVEIVPGEIKAIFSKHRTRKFDAMLRNWTAEYMDIESFSSFYWSPDDSDEAQLVTQAAWRAHWKIPDLSVIAELARSERDPQKRDALYKAVQYALQQRSPFIFMFARNHQTGIAHNIKGFVPLPTWGSLYYHGVQKE